MSFCHALVPLLCPFGNWMPVAKVRRAWIWMSRLFTLQDDNGGFELVGNAFQVKEKDARKLVWTCQELGERAYPTVLHWKTARHMRQDMKNIDDLKEVLTSNKMSFILFWNISQKRNDTCRAERLSLQDVLWSSWFYLHVQCSTLVE